MLVRSGRSRFSIIASLQSLPSGSGLVEPSLIDAQLTRLTLSWTCLRLFPSQRPLLISVVEGRMFRDSNFRLLAGWIVRSGMRFRLCLHLGVLVLPSSW